jgi:FPC/CPF motif-containing protein YcgG
MKRDEFEEFYEYITRFNTSEAEGYDEAELKENYWEELQSVSLETVMKKAKETYKICLVPWNYNLLSPKVFSGENPNPGLFGREEKKERFYM